MQTALAVIEEALRVAMSNGMVVVIRADHLREALAQARRAVLEEAARVCDAREVAHHNFANSYQEGRRDEADECGSAIRALTGETQ